MLVRALVLTPQFYHASPRCTITAAPRRIANTTTTCNHACRPFCRQHTRLQRRDGTRCWPYYALPTHFSPPAAHLQPTAMRPPCRALPAARSLRPRPFTTAYALRAANHFTACLPDYHRWLPLPLAVRSMPLLPCRLPLPLPAPHAVRSLFLTVADQYASLFSR